MVRARRLAACALACALAILVLATHGAAQGGFAREVVASGLDWPVSLAFLSQAAHGYPVGAIFYTERFTGDIRVLIGGQPRPLHVGNVPVETNGEQGLLGLALDPDFLSAPWIYAYHTYFNGTLGRDVNRVVRFWLGPQVPPGPPRMEVVLDGIPAASVHNGGIIGFAPDGTLFITTGDAANAANSQDNATLAGKVLRVNADGTIPASNPIPGSPIYSLGHRNVFGLAFHPVTGRPYISENGPSQNDEVNIVEPGRNYGWPLALGVANDPRFVDPILTYQAIIAPTGLAFYTGTNSSWRNSMFLGDWNRGIIQKIDLGGTDFRQVIGMEQVDDIGSSGILDVETGPDGTLYVSSPDTIYRFIGPRDGGTGGTTPPQTPVPTVVYIVVALLVAVAAFATWTVLRSRRAPPS